ncbi:MAG: alginate lyase family protein [Bacteroides stercoris]|nr:putative uncharacterized protein [Bacteroides stercoris CAG:120]
MKHRILTTMSLALLLAVQTSCRENEFGTVDLTMPDEEEIYTPVAAQYTYDHPCAMFNQADFDRVKKSLDDGTAPQAVKDEFALLKNSRYTVPGYTASPLEYIVRGDGTGITSDGKEHYQEAMNDAAAAYQMALLWKLTGDSKYADASVKVMNDWVKVCKGIKSNDANQMLAAGAQGYTFANAAEIMRSYEGWKKADFAKFQEWMVDVFASKNKEFMDKHQNTCDDHYWSNWDLVNMCSYLSIGILTENNDMVNFVVNYFYNGAGNGCIKKLIQGTFEDPLGSGEEIAQNQESGRDQGHAMMSVAVTANLCQMAYTLLQCNPSVPELDFFAAKDNAVMKMGEYTALFNLRDGNDQLNASGSWWVKASDMPFNEYKYCVDCTCKDKNHSAVHTVVADDSGRGKLRPGWEIYYNHYAKIKKLNGGYKYARLVADKMRPEGGVDGNSRYGTNSGAFDQLGWGTLMLYRE